MPDHGFRYTIEWVGPGNRRANYIPQVIHAQAGADVISWKRAQVAHPRVWSPQESMRVDTVRQNRDSRYVRFVVDGEGDIAGSQHVWICGTTEVAEIADGSMLIPHDCMRADGEGWDDGVGAGPCASDRLPLVVHPQRHPDAITCRERQLTHLL